jgi:hypothetical protein
MVVAVGDVGSGNPCMGKGYREVAGPSVINTFTDTTGAATDLPQPPLEPKAETDPWSRRPGDPNYGVRRRYER